MQKIAIVSAAAVAGFCSLGFELLMLRAAAPFFGASAETTGTIITSVLALMALGYFLGGRLIDQRPEAQVLGWALGVGGAYALLQCFVYTAVFAAVADLSNALGSLLAILVLCGMPMLAWAIVAPGAVRLIAAEQVGRAAGLVSAFGTLGAILGSVMTTFVFLPLIGVHMSMLLLAVLSIAGALPLLALRLRLAAGASAAALAIALGQMGESRAADVLFQTQSSYNSVTVVEKPSGERQLILNQPRWVQSVWSMEPNTSERYYDYLSLGTWIGGSKTLVLGMGAGTSVRQILSQNPEVTIDAVEIDPAVIDAAWTYFDLPRVDHLRVHEDDARRFLRRSQDRYDYVQLDVYHGGPHIPGYLVTQEAFAAIRDHLQPQGCVMVNVISPLQSLNRRILVDAIGATMHEVFENIYSVDLGANHLLIATALSRGALEEKLETAPYARNAAQDLGFLLEELNPLSNAQVLTDNRVPIERLTAQLLEE